MFKKLLPVLFFFTAQGSSYSQTIDRPNFGLKSHPSLEIESIVLSPNSTTLYMVVENKVLDGNFCADKNIFIIPPTGKRLKINSADGIPRCPDTHVFENFGEKLYFSLSFPALPAGTKWFDLLEDCNDACFSFNAVIVDTELNQKIDHAYSLVELKKPAEAYLKFVDLLAELSGKYCSFEGAVYLNLFQLSKQQGRDEEASEWMQKLKDSNNPLKDKFIETIR